MYSPTFHFIRDNINKIQIWSNGFQGKWWRRGLARLRFFHSGVQLNIVPVPFLPGTKWLNTVMKKSRSGEPTFPEIRCGNRFLKSGRSICTVVVNKRSCEHVNHLILIGVITPHQEVFFYYFWRMLMISHKKLTNLKSCLKGQCNWIQTSF